MCCVSDACTYKQNDSEVLIYLFFFIFLKTKALYVECEHFIKGQSHEFLCLL